MKAIIYLAIVVVWILVSWTIFGFLGSWLWNTGLVSVFPALPTISTIAAIKIRLAAVLFVDFPQYKKLKEDEEPWSALCEAIGFALAMYATVWIFGLILF